MILKFSSSDVLNYFVSDFGFIKFKDDSETWYKINHSFDNELSMELVRNFRQKKTFDFFLDTKHNMVLGVYYDR